jgi:FHS family glucose/mannose:H+ symporter-like MFS transporter
MKTVIPRIEATSPLWCLVMAFAGVGSTLLGPLLPSLLEQWHLHDGQAGRLAGCLFLGSFAGTLTMSQHLRRCLRRGGWMATLGCLLFAWSTYRTDGFAFGLLALILMGFGLGHLMSSINLLVGAAPVSVRARQLANLSAAWCVGAVLSPCLSTVLITGISSSVRVALFAPLYLLPFLIAPAETQPVPRTFPLQRAGRFPLLPVGAMLCTLAFLVYGGIEASIGAWVPVFATRYGVGPLVAAQWLLSLFWIGLIAGRVLMARLVSPASEMLLLRIAMSASLLCLLWLLVSQSFAQIAAATAAMGICISPLFPLLLSTTLSGGYSNRVMGVMLACCALGSAFFPWLLGILSSAFSLRAGMMVPIAALIFLVLFRWNVPRWRERTV